MGQNLEKLFTTAPSPPDNILVVQPNSASPDTSGTIQCVMDKMLETEKTNEKIMTLDEYRKAS